MCGRAREGSLLATLWDVTREAIKIVHGYCEDSPVCRSLKVYTQLGRHGALFSLVTPMFTFMLNHLKMNLTLLRTHLLTLFSFSQVKRKRKTISASPNRGYLRGHSTAGSSTELYLGLTPCCHGRVHSELSKTALPPDKTKANQVWGCTLFLGKTRPILLTVYMTAYLWKLEIRPWLWSECFHPSRRHTVKLNHQDAFRRRCLGGIRSWEGKPSWIEWWLPIPPIAWEAEGTTVHQTDEIV